MSHFFQKRPMKVQVERIFTEISIPTLEGTMIGRVGDWLVTGFEGEKWAIKDSIFRATYEPCNDDAIAYIFSTDAHLEKMEEESTCP